MSYITLCHTPCCLSPALNPREASLVVPHRELLLFVPLKWPLIIPSSHPASTGLLDKTTMRLTLILILCSKAGCPVPSIISAVAVEFTWHYPGTGLQAHPAVISSLPDSCTPSRVILELFFTQPCSQQNPISPKTLILCNGPSDAGS